MKRPIFNETSKDIFKNSDWIDELIEYKDSLEEHIDYLESKQTGLEFGDNSNIANMTQDLLENIGEWIESDFIQEELRFSGLKLSTKEYDEIHIKMANVAMSTLINSAESIIKYNDES